MKKTILITGCSSGIGLCCAKGLQKRGYQVFATARKPADIDMLNHLGLQAIQLDINRSDSIHNAIAEITHQTGGKLDYLFNNCSYAQPGAVEDLTRETIRAQFETNLFGPLELTTEIIKIMRKQGHGRIIQTGSLLGYVTMPYRGAYNASKFALEGLSDTLRQELRDSPLFVSVIEPGPIHSNIRENAKACFLKNIDIDKSIHQAVYKKMEAEFFQINAKKSFYLPPEAILKKLIHALESKKPKAKYYVGFPSYLFRILKNILPTSVLDGIIRMVLRRE